MSRKASSLIEQLEDNPLIASVCSVPLNCAIICNLWHTLDRMLPSTLTELYSQIVLNIIFRNLKKRNDLENFITLSFDSISEDLRDMFWLTCKFAYECLSQDKIVFSEKEIAPLFPQVLDSSDKLLCFGLLQCARSLLPVGQGLSFHFVHLTIQEFLAALHLVTLPNEEKLKVCEAHVESVRFAMVWRFLFGLGCQKEGSYSRKVICLDSEVVDRFLNTKYDNVSHIWLMFCHCSLESQSSTVSSKTAKLINGKFKHGYFASFSVDYFTSIAHSPHDCMAVFHVLHHTSHCFDIKIHLSNCGLTDKLLKKLTDILSSADGGLQVIELRLYFNKITDNGIADLFSRASASFSYLEELHLNNNRITNIIPLVSSCISLTSLSLSNNPLGVSGIQSLETAVQAGVLVNLRRLYLSNTLTEDADINGALLATLSPSIASHCPHLWKLDLSSNSLGVPGAGGLSGLFISDRSMLGVDDSANRQTADFSMSNLSHNQFCDCTLKLSNQLAIEFHLDLSDAIINAEAVASFAIFGRQSCDCRLSLRDNPLRYDGLLAIFRMLRSETCPITELDLANTDLTTPVNTESQYYNTQLLNTSSGLNLGPVIESNKLTYLSLNSNNFSGDRPLILAECVRVCQSLESLYCWSCSLTSSEFINILDHLISSGSSLKNLWKWELDNNSIDDEGVSALIESLPQLFPSLENVELNDNPVSGEAEEKLSIFLEVYIFKHLSYQFVLCCLSS